MNDAKKVLVVGASVAGPTVCYWLQKYGFSPTLIELSDSIRKGGFAIDIRGAAVDVAKKMGIYAQVVHRRTQLHSGRYVDAQGNLLMEEQGEAFGFRQGDDVEIVRGDLVEIIMNTIQEIPCYLGQSIRALVQHSDTVEVQFNDGTTKYYSLVIAADGLYSSTRGLVFSPDEYRMVNLGSYISVFTIENYLNLKHSEILFETDQKLVSINSDHDPRIANAGFMFRSEHQLTNVRDEQEQKAFLRTTFQHLGWESDRLLDLMDTSDDFYFDSITQVKMNTWTKGRVALLGDSGYCASPLSGQGTSLAMVGAYLLAGELYASEGDHSKAFERYNAGMRSYVQANQDFGVWSSETFLMDKAITKATAEQRTSTILEKLQVVSNAITLAEFGA